MLKVNAVVYSRQLSDLDFVLEYLSSFLVVDRFWVAG